MPQEMWRQVAQQCSSILSTMLQQAAVPLAVLLLLASSGLLVQVVRHAVCAAFAVLLCAWQQLAAALALARGLVPFLWFT
jgi:hypothetical protein